MKIKSALFFFSGLPLFLVWHRQTRQLCYYSAVQRRGIYNYPAGRDERIICTCFPFFFLSLWAITPPIWFSVPPGAEYWTDDGQRPIIPESLFFIFVFFYIFFLHSSSNPPMKLRLLSASASSILLFFPWTHGGGWWPPRFPGLDVDFSKRSSDTYAITFISLFLFKMCMSILV